MYAGARSQVEYGNQNGNMHWLMHPQYMCELIQLLNSMMFLYTNPVSFFLATLLEVGHELLWLLG